MGAGAACGNLPCYHLAAPQPVGSGAHDLLLDCNGDTHLDLVVAGDAGSLSVLVAHGDGKSDIASAGFVARPFSFPCFPMPDGAVWIAQFGQRQGGPPRVGIHSRPAKRFGLHKSRARRGVSSLDHVQRRCSCCTAKDSDDGRTVIVEVSASQDQNDF